MAAEVITPKAQVIDISDFLEGGILREDDFRHKMASINWSQYQDRKVIIKGCDRIPIPIWAYMMVVAHVAPYAKRIFWGEPCNAVPIYIKKSAISPK